MKVRGVQVIVAILVLVGIYIAVLFFSQNDQTTGGAAYRQPELKLSFRENERLLGTATASVKIVEYAEVECIYCKRLHSVLLRVIGESEGKVALVYRHFPLPIHPKSFTEAIALECAAEAGGDSTFFRYLEALYEATPSNNKIDLAILPELARTIGISKEIFNKCLAGDRHKMRVRDDMESGFALDVDSVPQLFVIAPNGKVFVFRNSPSYAVLNATIIAALGLTN
ncbi:MAG: thioredoxin domain-containing protein [bacterium]|nr:thioredoxin domain-containing protein [bacterium]